MIRLEKVSFGFGRDEVVRNLDLELRDGETVLLTGPNGSGKSTLLKLLAGVLKPDSGIIDHGLRGDPRKRTAFLPDSLSLYRSMTPIQAAVFHARVFGMEPSGLEMSRKAGIDLGKPISALSTGQTVLVHLDLVLSTDPDVILIDEVLHSVDSFLRDQAIRGLIDAIGARRPVVVLVNLDYHDTEHLVDRVIFMGRNGIVIDETLESLKASTGLLFLDESSEVPGNLPVLLSRRIAGGTECILHPIPAGIEDSAAVRRMDLSELMASFMEVEYDVR